MIVFIENNTNFIIHGELIKYLSQYHKLECCILTLSLAKERELKDKGIKAFFLGNIESSKEISFEKIITEIEKKEEGFTLAQYLNQDRHLKYYKYEKSYNILKEYTTKFYSFLRINHVKLILGELTWANELLFMHTANVFFNVPYVDVLNNYVFTKPRITFFDDKHTVKFMDLEQRSTHIVDGEPNFDELIEKRSNVNINGIFNSFSNYSLKKYIEKYKLIKKFGDSYDYKYDFQIKLKFNLNKKINKFLNKLLQKYLFDIANLNCNYYYLPLHIQPEATPDIVSPFYNNQLELIEKVSNSLPLDTVLYVKDHPDGLGYRDLLYYRQIRANKNVQLINSNFESSSLIKNSLGVITIAGTAGIEARLLNIPVVIFSDIFYGKKLDHVYSVRDFNELPKILKKFKYLKGEFISKNIKDFMKFVFNSSYDGYIYDPIIQSEVLNSENINKLGNAIIRLNNLLNSSNES
jgi:hypothetical protein